MRPIALASLAVLSLAWTLAPSPARAGDQPPLPAGVERVTALEGITEYRLANGLRVLLFPDATLPQITVNVTYLVGSRFEGYGETGMAHLLEHLMFKGSPRHTNIAQELTTHGASPNGSTNDDRTNYFEIFNATRENLDWALDLEADRMVHSFIAKKDLDSEMTVVRNELEMGENSPSRVLSQRIGNAAYDWHSYGRSTIGTRSDLEHVPIERLQAFYKTYYQPDNAVLVVAGQLDPAPVLALVAQKFGPIPRPARVLQPPYTVEPTQDGERQVTVRRVGDVQLVRAAYHIPAGAHPDSAPLVLLARILGDRSWGRLHKSLVETGKASSAFGYSGHEHDPGLLAVGATVPKESPLDAARAALLATVEAPGFAPATAEEVERAKNEELRLIDLISHSSVDLGLWLSDWMAEGDWRLVFLHRDRVRQVTAGDIDRVAAAYLKPANRTLGLFIPDDKPQRAEMPPSPDVPGLFKGYQGAAELAAGEAFDPSPANLVARTRLGATPNGLKTALLPKATRGGTVAAALMLDMGDERSVRGRAMVAQLTASMLLRGSRRHTRAEIQAEIARLRSQIDLDGGPAGVEMLITSVRESLPALLELLAEVLREPAFPAAELEQLKREMITRAEAQRSDPGDIAWTALSRQVDPYPPDHPHYRRTADEEIAAVKAVDLDAIKRFYADFYGASHAELTVVGDFPPRETEALVRRLFGSWESPRPYRRIANRYTPVPAANLTFETPDKANAQFIAAVVLPLRDDDPDYPALLLGDHLLGGGFLSSRLATRIRQKDGLSYGVGSFLWADPFDRHAMFTASALCAPQNVAHVAADFQEEMRRALDGGFGVEEVAAAKAGYLQSRRLMRSRDDLTALFLADYLRTGRTFAWDQAMDDKLAALTPAEILAALRRHLDPAKMVIIKAGDFAHAAAAPPAP